MTIQNEILIVEDEADLAALIADYAQASGFQSEIIANGAQALARLRVRVPQLIVLDLMLPGLDGLQLCREVRQFSQVPIIMVTAKVEEIDRLLGLEIGADDYLCKPFSPRELMARIKVILRRSETNLYEAKSAPNKAPAICINDKACNILLNQKTMDLTRTEFLLFKHFLQHPGQVFSRAQLLDYASQDSLDVTDRAIDSHIKNLRKKIALIIPDSNPIHAIYGLGYRFDGFDGPEDNEGK
ncbi:response regulator [Undibacterium seohonense]|uniref:Response regulator n=1 Tax=Undibacterium seohonense TaxID=1344950 RepID=A0ABR6X9Y6_9BURK|nr:response regulator [Undibacterium seohonense]MBC3809206.1 response regulator [Undibacterium seohonense]